MTVVIKTSGIPNKISAIANATQLYLLLFRCLKNDQTVHIYSSPLCDVSQKKGLQSWVSAEVLLLVAWGLYTDHSVGRGFELES